VHLAIATFVPGLAAGRIEHNLTRDFPAARVETDFSVMKQELPVNSMQGGAESDCRGGLLRIKLQPNGWLLGSRKSR